MVPLLASDVYLKSKQFLNKNKYYLLSLLAESLFYVLLPDEISSIFFSDSVITVP